MRRGTSLARCADAQRPNDSQIGPQACRATLNVRLKLGGGAPFRRPEGSARLGIPGAVSFSQALPGAESPLPVPSVCQLNLQDVSERRKARLLFFLYLNAKGNFPRAMRGRAATQRLANRSAGMSGDPERAAKIWERRALPAAGSERPEATPRVPA